MGLGPRNTRPGDEVVVMTGSRVPFVLRKTHIGNMLLNQNTESFCRVWRYNVIGDCYVHGIMNGEVVKDVDWNVDYTVFDLV